MSATLSADQLELVTKLVVSVLAEMQGTTLVVPPEAGVTTNAAGRVVDPVTKRFVKVEAPEAPEAKTAKAVIIGFTQGNHLAQRSRRDLKQLGVTLPKRESKASIRKAVEAKGLKVTVVPAAELPKQRIF